MPNANDMRWFKQQFQSRIEPAIDGTPFTLDLITALACQETGEIWPILRHTDMSVDRILELCVGDTKDAHSKNDPRHIFPATKEELESAPNGHEMFVLAHQLLVDMAQFVDSYSGAASVPSKFCHGFGIFQFDIQFFRHEPDYFLQRQYANFDTCLQKCLGELRTQASGIGLGHKTTLTDTEMAFVAIAYNIGAGHFNPSKGLHQGFPGDGGRRYGELVFDFLQVSKTVHLEDPQPTTPPAPGDHLFKVISHNDLRLRDAPVVDADGANVKTSLPNGQVVRAITNHPVDGFMEVETDFEGRHFTGFVAAQFLQPA
jgi:hypothetical protein